jgi:hypothetical protein
MYLGRADMLCPPVVSGFVPNSDITGRMGVLKSDDIQNGTAFRFEAKRGRDPVSGSRASTEVRGSHQLCLAHSFDHLIGESQQLDRFECRDFFRR